MLIYTGISPLKFLNKFCSDGWNDRPDVVEGNEENVAGGMSIKLTSPKIADFDQYFNSLNPYTNTRNPWFKEFWSKTFDCTFDETEVQSKGFRKCTGLIIFK